MKLRRREFLEFLVLTGHTLSSKSFPINNYLSQNKHSLLVQNPSEDFSLLQYVGSPCRDKQILDGTVVADPLTQEEWFVLTNMNEISNMELIFVDIINNRGEIFNCPAGSGSWAIKKIGANKLVIGTFYDGKLIVFDLQKKNFIATVDVPGETYIWNLALGSDGRIYGGTYPGAKLVALDLNSYTVEDCGAPVLPNLYLRFVSETPDGRILCSFRTQNTTTRLYNPSSKEFELVPKQLEKIHRGVSWNGYFLAQSKVFVGQSFKLLQDFPFPTPPANNGAWHVDLDLTTENLLVLKQGNALYRYADGDPSLTLCSDINLYGGKPLAVNRNFEVCGVRGQDYFVLDSSSTNINLQKIPVESGPRPIAVIKIDPLDRIWVASPIGSTIFSIDLSNQIITEISDIGRQVGDLSFFNDKIYAVSYTGGDITEYNTAIDWDKLYETNPRLIAKVGPAYIRPTGGVVTGLNGLLYSGWMARYNIYGGALAITNLLDNGQTEILENPLGQQAISGVAVDEHFIYLGTSLRGNGLPIKSGESAQLGVFDINTKSVIFQFSFDRSIEVTSIICNPELNLVAMLVMGRLHIFNPNIQEFVKNPILDSFSVTSRSIAFASKGDSLIYYAIKNSLFTISPETLKTKKIMEMSTPISHIRLDKNENVYIVCRSEIFKLDNNFK